MSDAAAVERPALALQPARPPWPWLLALLAAGALQVAAFAPLRLWWLQPLTVMALAALVLRGPRDARWGAWAGTAFGLGWFTTGMWWLYISLHDFGGMAAPLAALAVLLLCLFEAAHLGLAMALVCVCRCGRPVRDALLFAAGWLGMELARAQWFTGFPWIASGYAHTDGPLALLAPWLGVHGIGAVSALLATALVLRAWWPAAGVVVLTAFAALGPRSFTQPAGQISISLLQPNVAQQRKFDAQAMAANQAALMQQIAAAPGRLVLTPETAVALPRALMSPEQWSAIGAPVVARGGTALLGTFDGDDEVGWTNALVAAGGGAAAGYVYGKRHLLPFGEFVPAGLHWFVDRLAIPIGDQTPGTQTAPLVVAGQRVRPLICYEDLFGEDFVASMVGPQAATLVVNATNLAWFGERLVQDQHLQFSQMRALEFERPWARATNTGATSVIDHRGQVTARLPPLRRATLTASVQGRQGATPYARWLAALGLWPLWALVLAGLLQARLRQRQSLACAY